MRLFRQFLVVLCMVLVAFSPLQAALHHLICHAGPSVSFDFSPVGAKLVETEQSHRAVNHRAVNHRAVNHRAVNHRAVNHCAVNHCAVNHRAVNHRAVNHRAVNHCAVKKCGCGVAYRLSSLAESPELSILTTDDSDCQVCQQLAEPGVRFAHSILCCKQGR